MECRPVAWQREPALLRGLYRFRESVTDRVCAYQQNNFGCHSPRSEILGRWRDQAPWERTCTWSRRRSLCRARTDSAAQLGFSAVLFLKGSARVPSKEEFSHVIQSRKADRRNIAPHARDSSHQESGNAADQDSETHARSVLM